MIIITLIGYDVVTVHNNVVFLLKFHIFQINTSGIIYFYSEEWDIAVVAPLASDIDLSCMAPSTENLACYDVTEDPDLLSRAKSIIANETRRDSFNPTSLIIITWNKVQRYDCPKHQKVN
jgi:hypothetical protein